MWTLVFDKEKDNLTTTCKVTQDDEVRTSIVLNEWEPGVNSIDGVQQGNVVIFRDNSDIFAYHVGANHLQCLCDDPNHILRYTQFVPESDDIVSFCDKAWGKDMNTYGKHGVHIKWNGSMWVLCADLIGASNLPYGTLFVLGDKILAFAEIVDGEGDICNVLQLWSSLGVANAFINQDKEVHVTLDSEVVMIFPLRKMHDRKRARKAE